MKNYRYVSQGEYYITINPDTVLITTGMTECIALCLVDKANSANRLLCHFDGLIIYNKETATKNVQRILEDFKEETNAKDFKCYYFGGQKHLRNWKILSEVLAEASIIVEKALDANDFCATLSNSQNNSKKKIDPIDSCLTMISEANREPLFVVYSPQLFDPPISEKSLGEGKGLKSDDEKKQYALFDQINDFILSRCPEEGKIFRRCDDEKLIERMKNIASKTSTNLKLFQTSQAKNSDDSKQSQVDSFKHKKDL